MLQTWDKLECKSSQPQPPPIPQGSANAFKHCAERQVTLLTLLQLLLLEFSSSTR